MKHTFNKTRLGGALQILQYYMQI